MLAEINKLLGKLATTNRYSDTRLINPESVLEHTGGVALTALLIAQTVSEKGELINFVELLTKALLHDIDEAITGDIINPTKYASLTMKKEIDKYAEHCAKEILSDFDRFSINFIMWTQSKQDKEGLIVSIADKLQVVYKIEQEANGFGNRNLLSHLNKENIVDDLIQLRVQVHNIFLHGQPLKDIIDEGVAICKKI